MILVGHKSGLIEKIDESKLSEKAMGNRVYTIIGGEFAVCQDSSNVSFKTLLGSCVAMMFYDKVKNIKGMNHFLLPFSTGSTNIDMKYGLYSVEAMLNEMYKIGADKRNIEVKIAGGAHVLSNSTNYIGEKNINFAESFCKSEGFSIVSKTIRGNNGRVVLMGDSFQTFVKDIHNRSVEQKIEREEKSLQKVLNSSLDRKESSKAELSGGIELF